jgi:hypothetical protein
VAEKDRDIQFINRGFKKIFAECENLMKDVGRYRGVMFRRHAFSEESLMGKMEKIQSFAVKIRTDIENWARHKRLNERIRMFYNRNAGELQEQLDEIREEIETRQPTLWEKICGIFHALYRIVVEKILPVITFRLIPGQNPFKKIGEDI